MNFMRELWVFLRVRKKLWLAPIIVIMLIFGGLLILAQGSVVAHYLHTFLVATMYILGVSAFYHDSAACLIESGEIIAAAQEERFTERNMMLGFLIMLSVVA